MNNGFIVPEVLKELAPPVGIALIVVGGVVEICKNCNLDLNLHIGPAH